jgi:hypothetical protein
MGEYTQSQILELIKQWEKTNIKTIKTNLKAICKDNNITPSVIADGLKIPINTVYSYVNPVHKSRIEFKTGLELVEYLGIDINELLKNI